MILVTGASGHVGNVLVRTLVSDSYQVRALVLRGEDTAALDGLPIEIAEGDVLDPRSLKAAFEGVEIVYHLAGVISILPGRSDWVRRVNVEGTQNVLQAAKAAGVSRLIYTSSIHALQRAPHGTTIDEDVPFDPLNAIGEYDRSKAEASLMVKDAAARGLDAVILGPTGVIGPYDFRKSEMGQLISTMMRQKVVLTINGAYDFVDVRDVARGMLRAAECGRRGEVYILSGQAVSVSQLLAMINQADGGKRLAIRAPLGLAKAVAPLAPWFARLFGSRPLFTPYSLATVLSNSQISSAKARRELGFQARAVMETIRDTVAWWQDRDVDRRRWAAGRKTSRAASFSD